MKLFERILPPNSILTLVRCDFNCPQSAEFSKAVNPGIDGESTVDLFVILLCEQLKDLYGLNVGSNNIVRLDSTSEECVMFKPLLIII